VSAALDDIMARQMAAREGRTIPLCKEMSAECREAQARADRVAQQFGDSAPPPLMGELPEQYRRRLISAYARYSKAWRGTDLTPLAGKALDTVEVQVYADAMQEARQPTSLTLNPGELVERVVTDDAGRRTRRFFGDPEACWGAFKMPSRLVVGWGTK
jgi:hypothetical protein